MELIAYGVPQGPVLGPILFLVHFNDIVEYFQYCNITLFTDDIMISLRGNNYQQIFENFNEN